MSVSLRSSIASAAALLAAVPLLIWPALWNGHPILFPDSTAYGLHAATGTPPWDKALAYGWWLGWLSQAQSVWPVAIAQALLVSWLMWLTQRVARGRAEPGIHLLLALGLGLFSTAPWFIGFLMPDVFAAVAVLALWLLGFGEARTARAERWALAVLAAFALATHSTHLPLAVAVIGVVLLWRRAWRPVLRTSLPLLGALAIVIGGNIAQRGEASLSPTGSVFLFARLQADGPATRTLQRHCPAAGWEMCMSLADFPMHSDHFLWNEGSPLNRAPDGTPRQLHGIAFAAEARAINALTLREEPFAVLGAALANGARQLVTLRLGDTLDGEYAWSFGDAVLRPHFPPAAYVAFTRSVQRTTGLEAIAAPFDLTQRVALGLALILGLATALTLQRDPQARFSLRQRAGDDPRLALLACVLAGVVTNAFVCGGLSGAYDRYQARIIWLLPLAVALAAWPQRAPRTALASAPT